ncbi:MAG: PEP-CTERM sorting domain-containing protein [Burkholderiales bacterium]|nr:MAG: PEP-CTERM sorting domain-containing protein [Burkholderiales bacterium]
MKLKSIAAAVVLTMSALAGASTTLNAGSYSVTYNETTPGFGWITSWFSNGGSVGFEWSIDPSVNVTSVGGALASATFALPDFTITANPGYTLSGPVTGSLGNIVYFQNGAGATTSLSATGVVSVNGGPATPAPWGGLPQTTVTPTFGYFSGSSTAPLGAFTSFSVSAASITLSASGGSFASIGAQPQNKLKFEFTATPVPEPETYALMLAGLGLMGYIGRRRQGR